MPITPAEAYKNADIVFIGSVVSLETQGPPELVNADNRIVRAFRGGRKAVFQVYKLWKGPQITVISISTGEGGGDCGIDFIVGREYLVYASQNKGQWYTGICSRPGMSGSRIGRMPEMTLNFLRILSNKRRTQASNT